MGYDHGSEYCHAIGTQCRTMAPKRNRSRRLSVEMQTGRVTVHLRTPVYAGWARGRTRRRELRRWKSQSAARCMPLCASMPVSPNTCNVQPLLLGRLKTSCAWMHSPPAAAPSPPYPTLPWHCNCSLPMRRRARLRSVGLAARVMPKARAALADRKVSRAARAGWGGPPRAAR